MEGEFSEGGRESGEFVDREIQGPQGALQGHHQLRDLCQKRSKPHEGWLVSFISRELVCDPSANKRQSSWPGQRAAPRSRHGRLCSPSPNSPHHNKNDVIKTRCNMASGRSALDDRILEVIFDPEAPLQPQNVSGSIS